MSEDLIDVLGFDPLDPRTHPDRIKERVEQVRKELQENLPQKGRIALELKRESTGAKIIVDDPSPESFPRSDSRRDRGVPHILIDDPAKIEFSNLKTVRRAIRMQTAEFGFIPRVGMRGLEEGVDFEFVAIGAGKNSRTEVWVNEVCLLRLHIVTPAMIKTELDFEESLRQESAIAAKEHASSMDNSLEIGVAHRLNQVTQHLPIVEDDAWFRARGLYVPSKQELEAQQRQADLNKPIRMKQRLDKILQRCLKRHTT